MSEENVNEKILRKVIEKEMRVEKFRQLLAQDASDAVSKKKRDDK